MLRSLKQTIPALATSDGAGVRIKRSLGQRQSVRMDPFLMLDEFGSDQPQDYIAGFPAHRGTGAGARVGGDISAGANAQVLLELHLLRL